MRRRLACATAGLMVLLLLAACNVAAKVVVRPDGSGSYSVIMTVPNARSNPGEALYRALRNGTAQSDFPLTVTHYSSAVGNGAMVTFRFKSLADLNAESHRLAASGKGGIGVTINRDASGWHFTASTSQTVLTVGPAGSGATGGPINASQLGSIVSIDLVVQLPGVPGESNAKTVAHSATASTFTWALSSTQQGTVLQASTTYVGNQADVQLASGLTPVAAHHAGADGSTGSGLSGGNIALIAAGAVLVLGAAVLVVVTRRRKSGEPAVTEPAGSPVAPEATAD